MTTAIGVLQIDTMPSSPLVMTATLIMMMMTMVFLWLMLMRWFAERALVDVGGRAVAQQTTATPMCRLGERVQILEHRLVGGLRIVRAICVEDDLVSAVRAWDEK